MKSKKRPTVAAPSSDLTVPRTEATLEGVSQAALEVQALALDAIRDEITRIERQPAGKSKRDKGSLIGSLAAKAGAIYEGMRKAESARLKRLEAITPALVLAWFRQLDRSGREHILRELSLIESRRSGLA